LAAGSTIFSEQILQRHVVQGEVRHHSFQLGILFFEPFQLLGIADLQTAILRLPFIKCCFAHAMLSAEVGRLGSGFSLLEDADNLLLRKSICFHFRSLSS
jgi:hypothetical protein